MSVKYYIRECVKATSCVLGSTLEAGACKSGQLRDVVVVPEFCIILPLREAAIQQGMPACLYAMPCA